MKRKILLTGSSGFLGTKFIELYGGQYKIMGVSRSDPLTPVDLLDFDLDARKLFKPVLIDHICNIFAHYIKHDTDKRIILNLGVDKATTYYDFILDVSNELDFDLSLIKSDGEEAGWPPNSTLSLKKLQQSGYPTVNYTQLLEIIKKEAGHSLV